MFWDANHNIFQIMRSIKLYFWCLSSLVPILKLSVFSKYWVFQNHWKRGLLIMVNQQFFILYVWRWIFTSILKSIGRDWPSFPVSHLFRFNVGAFSTPWRPSRWLRTSILVLAWSWLPSKLWILGLRQRDLKVKSPSIDIVHGQR